MKIPQEKKLELENYCYTWMDLVNDESVDMGKVRYRGSQHPNKYMRNGDHYDQVPALHDKVVGGVPYRTKSNIKLPRH